jgi:RNA polymerase sigma factor (sigma-70 family)
VFVLHDVEGFSSNEVAEHLGVAEGTVRAHLHRARSQLREALR